VCFINKVYLELEKQELEEMQNNYNDDLANQGEEEYEDNENNETVEEAKKIVNK
jgi:hypothetical protein